MMAGCASTPPPATTIPAPATTIHEDARSAVYFEKAPERSFRAAHPLKLEESTVENVLRGVHTEKKATMTLLFGKALKSYVPSDTPVFWQEDIALLTPHLTAALAQAAPNQRVGFRLRYTPDMLPTSSKKIGVATTEGYLFARGQSLHFTLTLYRHVPEGAAGKTEKMDDPRPLPDADGLRDLVVKFVPEKAAQSENLQWYETSDERTVMIDYQLLDKLIASPPEPALTATPPGGKPVPPPPVAGAQPIQPSPTTPRGGRASDPELQALKEELKELQKQMEEQSAELEKLKKPPQKKKSSP